MKYLCNALLLLLLVLCDASASSEEFSQFLRAYDEPSGISSDASDELGGTSSAYSQGGGSVTDASEISSLYGTGTDTLPGGALSAPSVANRKRPIDSQGYMVSSASRAPDTSNRPVDVNDIIGGNNVFPGVPEGAGYDLPKTKSQSWPSLPSQESRARAPDHRSSTHGYTGFKDLSLDRHFPTGVDYDDRESVVFDPDAESNGDNSDYASDASMQSEGDGGGGALGIEWAEQNPEEASATKQEAHEQENDALGTHQRGDAQTSTGDIENINKSPAFRFPPWEDEAPGNMGTRAAGAGSSSERGYVSFAGGQASPRAGQRFVSPKTARRVYKALGAGALITGGFMAGGVFGSGGKSPKDWQWPGRHSRKNATIGHG